MANSDGSIVLKTEIDDSGLQQGFGKLSSGVKAVGKAFAVVGAVGATAMIGIGKKAIDSYAEYEQLAGGVETLFKDSSDKVMQYANNAYKTAGLSANQYMETVTGFSASLIQSLGGDTGKATEYANQAVVDMSDNANKMGTDIGSIQHAYQGFSRGLFGMLDNLKLGYGGTKEEMERLLADAEKISGIHYDISSFGDVAQAIHVMQESMGIAGTTATEAETTIQGSLAMVGSTWQNLLTGMSDDTQNFDVLLENFVNSIGVAMQNLLPRITIVADGFIKLLEGVIPLLPGIISEILPVLIEGVESIVEGVAQEAPNIVNAIVEVIPQLVSALGGMLPMLLEAGIQIAISLLNGLTASMPQIIAQMPVLITQLVSTLTANAPALITAGLSLIMALAQGLINALPQLIAQVPVVVSRLVTMFTNNAPKLISTGLKLIGELAKGLIKAIPSLVKAVPQIVKSLVAGFKNLASKFSEVGKNMVKGLWKGIQNAKNWILGKIKEWCGSLLKGIKAFFGIHSPSKVMEKEVGAMLPKGMAIGIDKAKHFVVEAFDRLLKDTRTEVQKVQDELNKELLKSEQFYIDEQARLKDQNDETTKQYLDGLKKTSETERKLYDARAKDVENLKKEIVSAYSDIAEESIKSIQDLEKEQKKLEDKLSDYGDLIEEKTYKDRNGEHTVKRLASIEEQTKGLEAYRDMLISIKERENVPQEFFEVLRDLGVDEGTEFASELLKLSDEDFDKYISDWKNKQQLSKDISKEFYQDEADELATEINTKFDEVEQEFFGEGASAGKQFDKGFLASFRETINTSKQIIKGAFSSVGNVASAIRLPLPATATGSVIPTNSYVEFSKTSLGGISAEENNLLNNFVDKLASKIAGGSPVILQIDGREFGRAVVTYGGEETRRIGTRLVTN